jgi:hypothetical protein
LITGTHCYQNMEGYSNLQSTKWERLEEHFDTKVAWRGGAMYRILSKDLFSRMMKLFDEISEFSTPYIFEVSAEMLINSSGTTRYLEDVYWIRNWIIEPVGNKNWDRKVYFDSWVNDPKTITEVVKWKKTLSKFIEINQFEQEKILQKVITLRRRVESREVERKSTILFPIPSGLKYGLRKVIKSKAMPKNFYETLEEMKNKGIKFQIQEIEEAVSVITS